MTPLISVMTPCYNAAKTLPLALASLIAQTYPNWECILVDDGSTDRPVEIVQAANDSRIRFFRFEENKGRGIARQYALDMAQGDYLCMLDADDWIYPHKLARQLEVMEQHPEIAVLSTGMAIVNGDNEIVGVRLRGVDRGTFTQQPPLKTPVHPPIAHAPSMLRASIAKHHTYDPKLQLVEDADFLLKMLLRYPFAVLSEITYAYAEIESVDRRKVLQSLRNNRRIYSKYRHNNPRAVLTAVAVSWLKELVYRIGFAAGFGERLIARRSKPPTEQARQEFYRARALVYQSYATVFSDLPYKDFSGQSPSS